MNPKATAGTLVAKIAETRADARKANLATSVPAVAFGVAVVAVMVVGVLVVACGPAREETAAAPAQPPPEVVEPPAEYPSPLADLRALVGRYPRDIDLWNREPLAGRLRVLLGERHAAFVENTEVQSPLLEEDGILYVTGNKQHSGGSDAAALVADLRRDAIWVWLLVGGESEAFLDRDVEVELPVDVRIVLENAEPAPLPHDDEEHGDSAALDDVSQEP